MRRKGHVPHRRCVGCRRVRPQAELVRLVQADGVYKLDLNRREPGRGSWVCRDTSACWTPKRLGRTFRAQTDTVTRLLQETLGNQVNTTSSAQDLPSTNPPTMN